MWFGDFALKLGPTFLLHVDVIDGGTPLTFPQPRLHVHTRLNEANGDDAFGKAKG